MGVFLFDPARCRRMVLIPVEQADNGDVEAMVARVRELEAENARLRGLLNRIESR